MNYRRLLILILTCTLATIGASAQDRPPDTAKERIEQVLADQAKAWNRGDIEAFMDGYAKIPTLRFASGDSVTYGWQSTLERYKAHYPDRAAMGALSFTYLDITVLSLDAAVVFGHWSLKVENGEPHGLFTLIFRKVGDDWRVTADHTSAATPNH